MSLRDYFFRRHAPKKSLKGQVKDLEDRIEKLEKASFISFEVGSKNFFSNWVFIGVSEILGELLEKLGYKLVYREEVKKKRYLIKK